MSESHPNVYGHVRVDAAGRVVVPIELRQKFHIEPGEELILSADEFGMHLQTFDQAVEAAQATMAPYRIPGRSIVDELIADREAEARREYRLPADE
jgi:AbrB family looped-hinge helix DNA binding protein